jgi:hypothetical protein
MQREQAYAVSRADPIEAQRFVAVTNAEERGLLGLLDERGELGQRRATEVELVVKARPKLEQAHADAVMARIGLAIKVAPVFEDRHDALDGAARQAGRFRQFGDRRFALIPQEYFEHVQRSVD